MKIRILLTLAISILFNTASAENLVEGAKITAIGSTNWNQKVFYVRLEGGTGPCAGKSVNFPEEYSQSTISYAQTHSMAMTALLHNLNVSIHNYDERKFKNEDICTGANLIEVSTAP